MQDRSFSTLIYSLVVHGAIAWALLYLPFHSETLVREAPIEISVQDIPRKSRSVVTETEAKENVLDKLKDKADYLSQFTKRVKEQLVARNSGATKNRTGKEPVESDEMRAKGANGDGASARAERSLQLPQGEGAKSGQESGANPFGRQVVVGASTMGEYIPGVKEGAFTSLNSDRFTYYTFFARVNEQVRSRWIQNLRNFSENLSQSENESLASRERVTEIDVQLNRAGEFVRALVMRSSGAKGLDQAATEAFRIAAPFVNPPQQMIEADGLIHLRYGFLVQWSPTQVFGGR